MMLGQHAASCFQVLPGRNELCGRVLAAVFKEGGGKFRRARETHGTRVFAPANSAVVIFSIVTALYFH